MYAQFYGFKETPFGLTPNPKYIFKTESYLEVISSLKYCISQYKGLVVVLGEVGTGKTTTLRSMLQQLGPDIVSIYILNPFLTVPEFYHWLTKSLRLDLAPSCSKPELLETLAICLARRHAKGSRTVLIADEAHGLSQEVLEEIRLLANLETNTEKLLQIVLCGQPELRETLNRPNLRQIKQRIAMRCTINPLEMYEINKYIRFRMKTAGAERLDIFDSEAIDLIGRLSQGIPRVINNICDNALLRGYADNQEIITRDIIQEVATVLDICTDGLPGSNQSDLHAWTSPSDVQLNPFDVPHN